MVSLTTITACFPLRLNTSYSPCYSSKEPLLTFLWPLRCNVIPETSGPLRLVHEKLDKELEDVVIQSQHRAVLYAVVELQAFCAPHEVLPGVVGTGVPGQCHCVELVAEEREVLPVCDHGLGCEGPGHVLVVPETWECLSDVMIHR